MTLYVQARSSLGGLDPLDYNSSLATYSSLVAWVGEEDYWTLELACVQQLVQRVGPTAVSTPD